ncbi:MAG: hypothetical protein ACXV5K_11875 [Halobacteriota archaeon]
MPKGEVRKHVTSRIVTKEDVENIPCRIKTAFAKGEIEQDHYQNFRAIVLFGAFTGQRPQAKTARVKVEQFRTVVR